MKRHHRQKHRQPKQVILLIVHCSILHQQERKRKRNRKSKALIRTKRQPNYRDYYQQGQKEEWNRREIDEHRVFKNFEILEQAVWKKKRRTYHIEKNQMSKFITRLKKFEKNQQKIMELQQSPIEKWLMWSLSIILLGGAFTLLYEYYMQQQLRDRYRKQELKVPTIFVANTSIEQQIERYIRAQSQTHLNFLVGVPGTGKTTAVMNIITKMRQKNQKLGNLRHQKQISPQENLQKKVEQLQKLYKAISNQRKNRTVRVIIDDINNLESFSTIEDGIPRLLPQFQLMENFIPDLLASNTFLVVISSSSSYAQHAQTRPIGKSSLFRIINSPPSNELNLISNCIIDRFKNKFSSMTSVQKVKKLAFETGLPLRQMQTWLNLQNDQKQTDMYDYLFQKYSKYKQIELNRFQAALEDVDLLNQNYRRGFIFYTLLQEILNSPQKVDQGNKSRILQRFRHLDGTFSKIYNLLTKLQKLNFLNYSKPRYGIYQNIIKEIQDQYKIKMEKENLGKGGQKSDR